MSNQRILRTYQKGARTLAAGDPTFKPLDPIKDGPKLLADDWFVVSDMRSWCTKALTRNVTKKAELGALLSSLGALNRTAPSAFVEVHTRCNGKYDESTCFYTTDFAGSEKFAGSYMNVISGLQTTDEGKSETGSNMTRRGEKEDTGNLLAYIKVNGYSLLYHIGQLRDACLTAPTFAVQVQTYGFQIASSVSTRIVFDGNSSYLHHRFAVDVDPPDGSDWDKKDKKKSSITDGFLHVEGASGSK